MKLELMNLGTNNRVLKIHPNDNVLVALADLHKGDVVSHAGENRAVTEDVPAKHKFAIRDFHIGDQVIMYGVIVGKATKPILKGQAVTVLNTRHEAAAVTSKNRNAAWTPPDVSHWEAEMFLGYRRAD